MSVPQTYEATASHLLFPIVFMPHLKEEYTEFISNYNPKAGFLIAKTKTNYFIYSNGYQYKLGIFDRKGVSCALKVTNCDGISQMATITMATKAIRITNFAKSYFILSTEWNDYTHNSLSRGFSVSLSKLNAILNQNEKSEDTSPDPLWQHLLNINDEKISFSSRFLVKWPYTSFEKGDKITDGYQYIFRISSPDSTIRQNKSQIEEFLKNNNIQQSDSEKDDSLEALREDYINKFTPGSIVEIPLNRPADSKGNKPMLYGTVVRLVLEGVTHTKDGEPLSLPDTFYNNNRYFNIPWSLVLSFKDDSYVSVADIPSSNGLICERISTDYQHYKTALNKMKTPGSDQHWDSAEQVLIKKEATPFTNKLEPKFTSTTLNENQKEAIRMALNTPDFLLVQGPPGSGKTTIIAEMIRNFVNRGQRVLVCSKGNLAVDNILEKWIKENKDRSDSHLCIRLGDRFKLDFLKDYIPAKVTARVQEKAHNKTKAERQALADEIGNQIKTVEANRVAVDTMAVLCIAACELAQSSYDLATLCANIRKKDLIKQKQEFATKAFNIAYYDIMLLCYRLLSTNLTLTPQDIDQFDLRCQELYNFLTFALRKYKPGFFERLFSKSKIKQREALENKLQQATHNFFNLSIQGHNLCTNPILSVESLRLPPFAGTPAPEQIKQDVQNLRSSLVRFSEQENLRLSRINTVLNDWLVELGSGVSSGLEKNVVLNSIPVIGSTCMGIMSDSDFRNNTYDVVIVDEAGQIPIFDLLVPIIMAKKVILIGDHLQLPPMDENDFAKYYASKRVDSKDGKALRDFQNKIAQWYNISLFEKLYNAPSLESARIMLNTQYRMHPDICSFISDNFYDGKYLSGVSKEKRALQIAGFNKPIYFYDTCNLDNSIKQETNHHPGYSNTIEAEIMSDILLKLILAIRKGAYQGAELVLKDKEGNIIGYDIGVISGYKKQVKSIYTSTLRKLELHMPKEEALMHMDRFMISSVDSFQGRDNQIILFSMTRSNSEGKIGFLKDVRRLNVAMTRAKSLLIMTGDSSTLTTCPSMCAHDNRKPVAQIYKNLIDYCATHNYYNPLKGE